MGRILVTGTSGTVGGHVASRLVSLKKSSPGLDASIRLGARAPEKVANLASEGVEVQRLDYMDKESLKRCFDGVDTLFLLFPLQIDVADMAANVVDAAQRAGVEYIVKVSEWDVEYIAEFSSYYREELRAEKMLTSSGIPIARVHPTGYMDNFYKFWNAPQTIRAEDRFYLAFGDAVQTLVDTRDVAEAAIKLLLSREHAGRAYNLTGVSTDMHALSAVFSEVLGRKITYVPMDLAVAEGIYKTVGLPGWLVEALGVLNRLSGEGRWSKLRPDLEGLLGKKPRSFHQFLVDHRSYFA